MNKALIKRQFAKAAATYSAESIVQKRTAERLMGHIAENEVVSPQRILEIGCGTGHLSRELTKNYTVNKFFINDLCEEMAEQIKDVLALEGVEFSAYDADDPSRTLPENLDIIATASALQWFTDPQNFFDRSFSALKKGGILAIATFGGRNIEEFAELTTSTLRYPEAENLGEMLKSHFDILHISSEIQTLYFPRALDALRHLKLTGVNAISTPTWTKGKLEEFLNAYENKFMTPSGVSLTYNPLYIIAQKR